ncbi:MAG: hypothetical protein E7415_03270 [Ruminococcaceae bacterium]|nr:hypothetical protein [Oscillospiraceae bacterium]
MKVSAQNTVNKTVDKRAKRAEKVAKADKLTNGFMLTLTFGIVAIFLLEIAKRNYASWEIEFPSKYCIVLGVLFAVMIGGVLVLAALKKMQWNRAGKYTILFTVSSLVSFFISYDMRLPISRALFEKGNYWSKLDFLANLNLARDIKMIEYAVVAYVAIAFVVYAIRLVINEKRK